MFKEASYREKAEHLKPFLDRIVLDVKKELKNKHLRENRAFAKRHFGNKVATRLTKEELLSVYPRLMCEEEELAEYLCSQWIVRQSEIYNTFADYLRQITPDFDAMEELSVEEAQPLLNAACSEYGPTATYIFSVMNSVVFPQEVFENLRTQALDQLSENEEAAAPSVRSEEELQRELQRMAERYEKKFQGLEKKYQRDVLQLKKQIATLQRKLDVQTSLHAS